MGNRPSSFVEVEHTSELYSAADIKCRPAFKHFSEENYLPMTTALKRTLLAGKRFRHVAPSSIAWERGVNTQMKEVREREASEPRAQDEAQEAGDVSTTGSQSRSLGVLEERRPEAQQHLYFMRSPTLTNRRYSLMDTRLSAAKSNYAMELQDKLRLSKLELGFNDEISDWKEFIFKENHEGGRKSREKQVIFDEKHDVIEDLNCLACPQPEAVEYCTHNCQVMGLCGVQGAHIFPELSSFKPLVIEEKDSNCECDTTSPFSGKKKHFRTKDCNCDVCMLAYLTDMGFPDHNHDRSMRIEVIERDTLTEGGRTSLEWLKKPTQSVSNTSKRIEGEGDVKKAIMVTDKDESNTTVQVNISSIRSNENNRDNSSTSGMSRISFEKDSTNNKIRKLFQKNNMHGRKTKRSDYTTDSRSNNLYTAVVPSYQESKPSNQSHKQAPEDSSQTSVRSATIPPRKACRQSSSSVLSRNFSSLSTVISYKRVRQIFQTIIEKNRPRRRLRRNIHKFLEMEELGLGHVRNNRWYPSDHKTLSIWNDINSSTRGVQAQFKKYHRTRT